MRAVDTNVLVRVLARDDVRQVAAAEAFVHGGAWVSLLVLQETVWVLDAVYGRNRAQIADVVEGLLDHADLVVEHADVVSASLVEYRAHPRVGFSDCLILETARRAGHLPLGTFDRHFAKLDGTQRL
jgi:predicted nucleic-acid-binding protein